jgi:hypothetical protein
MLIAVSDTLTVLKREEKLWNIFSMDMPVVLKILECSKAHGRYAQKHCYDMSVSVCYRYLCVHKTSSISSGKMQVKTDHEVAAT